MALARYATDVVKTTACLIVSANDNPGFGAQFKTFRKQAEDKGVKIVVSDDVPEFNTILGADGQRIAFNLIQIERNPRQASRRLCCESGGFCEVARR